MGLVGRDVGAEAVAQNLWGGSAVFLRVRGRRLEGRRKHTDDEFER